MNPLDKSWEFLKAPMEGGENKEELRRRAAARREKLRAAAAKKKGAQARFDDPRFQMSRGDPDLSMTPESRVEAAKRIRDEFGNPKLRAEIEARNKKAKANLEAEAEGPKYPNPPVSEPAQSNLVSSTGINDPHDPRTMQPRRGA